MLDIGRAEDRTLVHLVRLTPPALASPRRARDAQPAHPASAVQLHDHLKNLAADLNGRAIILTGNDPPSAQTAYLPSMRDITRPWTPRMPRYSHSANH
ncbi:MAG: hypothetical protein H0U06_01970 [Solirubrobacterales bacterium]|nr:hypothetical protein [Solirubrobacterales bacterium]